MGPTCRHGAAVFMLTSTLRGHRSHPLKSIGRQMAGASRLATPGSISSSAPYRDGPAVLSRAKRWLISP